MDTMHAAQARPWLILQSKRVEGSGVRHNVNSKGKKNPLSDNSQGQPRVGFTGWANYVTGSARIPQKANTIGLGPVGVAGVYARGFLKNSKCVPAF